MKEFPTPQKYHSVYCSGYSLSPDLANAATVSVSLIEGSTKGRQPNSGKNGLEVARFTLYHNFSCIFHANRFTFLMHSNLFVTSELQLNNRLLWKVLQNNILNFWKIHDLLLLEDLIYPKQHWREVKKISVESFFWKVVQFEFILSIYFCFSFDKNCATFQKTD